MQLQTVVPFRMSACRHYGLSVNLEAGTTVDRYVVESLLGEGGVAQVYRVRHADLGTTHAMKVLALPFASVRERLLQEGRIQAGLRHRNVVAVTDVVRHQGAPALVMEYVDGPTLDHALKQLGRLSHAQAEAAFRGVVEGLRAAHELGLVHRDLKTANILLGLQDGVTPKITDFGLAKIVQQAAEARGGTATRTGATMGTPAYMPPEQIRDAKDVDARADLYALGVILYQLYTGALPYAGRDFIVAYEAAMAQEYTPIRDLAPDAPDWVVEAVQQCLVPDRQQRIASCDALLALLPEPSGAAAFNADDIAQLAALGPGPPAKGTSTASSAGGGHATGETILPAALVDQTQDPWDSWSVPQQTVDALPTEQPSERSGSKRVLLWGIGAVVGAFALWIAVPRGPDKQPEAPPVATEPAPVVEEPQPNPPEPAEAPVSTEPEADEQPAPVQTPRQAPKPQAEAAPAPPPASPDPQPNVVVTRIAPETVATQPTPADDKATIDVTGVGRAYLVGGGRQHKPGQVPPGTYALSVFFDQTKPTQVLEITVSAGEERTVRCDANMRMCR